MKRSVLVGIVVLVGACKGGEAPSPQTADAVPTSSSATTLAPAAPSSASPAATAPSGPLQVAVENASHGLSGPAKDPLKLTATSASNGVVVHVENYVSYCSPSPTFTAQVEAETLIITGEKASGPVSKCFAPYAFDLRVASAGTARNVSLRSAEGKEAGTAAIVAK